MLIMYKSFIQLKNFLFHFITYGWKVIDKVLPYLLYVSIGFLLYTMHIIVTSKRETLRMPSDLMKINDRNKIQSVQNLSSHNSFSGYLLTDLIVATDIPPKLRSRSRFNSAAEIDMSSYVRFKIDDLTNIDFIKNKDSTCILTGIAYPNLDTLDSILIILEKLNCRTDSLSSEYEVYGRLDLKAQKLRAKIAYKKVIENIQNVSSRNEKSESFSKYMINKLENATEVLTIPAGTLINGLVNLK